MEGRLTINPKMLRKYNIMRYQGIPPSQDLIDKVVKKSGLKRYLTFETVWGIPAGTLTLVNIGERSLPVKYWHIFYDFEFVLQKYSKIKQKNNFLPKKTTITPTSKTSIDELKRHQSSKK